MTIGRYRCVQKVEDVEINSDEVKMRFLFFEKGHRAKIFLTLLPRPIAQ